MTLIEIMIEEHKNIKRMLLVIRSYCLRILKGEEVELEDIRDIIDFVRSYADKYHHGKEESMLFKRMTEELGPTADKLVRYGMLVEHDLGRLYMSQLESAIGRVEMGDMEAKLDIIANAIGYTDLLTRHINKEDNVVYKFAENNLSKDSIKELEIEGEKFEEEALK
jgi:hemerythrin-like domain-containing protein